MAARKAVALDPDLAEAHQMLAFVMASIRPRGKPIFAMRLSSIRAILKHCTGGEMQQPSREIALCRSGRSRRALALDPVWKTPRDAVARSDLNHGRRVEAHPIWSGFEPPTRMQRWKLKWACCRISRRPFARRRTRKGAGKHRVCAGVCRQDESAWSLDQMGYVRGRHCLSAAFRRSIGSFTCAGFPTGTSFSRKHWT